MTAKQQKIVGRTKWDLITELIHSPTAVKAAAVVGWLVILGAVAALWSGYATIQFPFSSTISSKPLRPSDYRISISSPAPGEQPVSPPFSVSGYSEPLPEGFELWLFTTLKPGSPKAYWPLAPSEIRNRQWSIRVTPESWNAGEVKHYAVFIVGKEGKELIQYYKTIMKAMSKPGDAWMPLTVTTPDMVKCVDAYSVKLK